MRFTADDLTANLVNWLSLWAGVALTAVGISSGTERPMGIILVSIGTSLIASAIVVLLSARYLTRHRDVQEMIETWGLLGIYRTRSAMNSRCDLTLADLKRDLDLMGFGFLAFRHTAGPKIEALVKAGLRVRVLTLPPTSDFVAQRERDEGGVAGQIAHTIDDMAAWIVKLKAISPNPEFVQLRFCETAMVHSYYRQDDFLYTGPYLYGRPSQQTISYEFKRGGVGFEYWSGYFEKLWTEASKEPTTAHVTTT